MSFGKMIYDSKATGGGNNIRDGIYKFMVEKIELVNGYKDVKSYIAELRVLDSKPSGARDQKTGQSIIPNPIGSSCSFVCRMDFDAAPGNVKAFVVNLLAGLGYTEDKVTAEVIDTTYAAHNPCRGMVLIDETYEGINKGRRNAANAGQKLTLNKWKPVAQSKEDVKKGRLYLDTTLAKADVAAPVAQTESPAPVAQQPAAPAADMDPALADLLGM